MNLTDQLRSIAKEASFQFPIEEVIETCFSEARAGNFSKNFTPSDFGLANSPIHPEAISNQVKWMDEAVAILRERGLVVYREMDSDGAYEWITVDWSEVK
jgi:hypothetical protein